MRVSLLILPDDLKRTCVGRLYDDVTRTVKADVESRIKDGLGHGTYPSKSFYAYVWYEAGAFRAEVWQQKFQTGSYQAPDAATLVQEIKDNHG